MATEVIMPKLGLTMVDGKIIEWRKREGEAVKKGEILFVIETEKVTYEVEAPVSGILGKVLVPEGETKPVREVLAYIVQPGETLPGKEVKKEKEIRIPIATPGRSPVSVSTAAPLAKDQGEKVKISPLARKLAQEHGLDISGVKGTGPEGRIVKEDILRAVEVAKTEAVAVKTILEEPLPSKGKVLPLSGIRRTIARRMSESFQTPHFWIGQQVEATQLKIARERLIPSVEAETGQRLTYTDLIIKAVAQALQDHPRVNSRWVDNQVEVLEEINVGLATNLEAGLVVPVIRQANKRPLAEITRIRVDIVNRGREGKLGIDEMTGSTITITNLGMEGIEFIYPILNPPEASIVAVGSIKERPIVADGKVIPQLSTNLTLGIDHRVLDGFIGAQFLTRVKELLENPLLFL